MLNCANDLGYEAINIWVNEATTQRLAMTLMGDHYHVAVLPGGNVALIAQLQQDGKAVYFVADGLSDALALK